MLHLSSHPSYSLIALLSRAGNILSVGINKKGNPPEYVEKLHNNMGIHAEACCLRGISKKQAKGSTLYIVGQTAAGSQILCKPCLSCNDFIQNMGVKRVVFEDAWGELQEMKIC